jgi:quercetin dioxygenase-like cupin family protein
MQITTIKNSMVFSSPNPSKVTLASGENSKGTLWCLEPQQEIRPHAHAGDHHWIIYEGKGVFLTEDSEHPVEAGSIVFAPTGELHGIRATEKLIFVSISAG